MMIRLKRALPATLILSLVAFLIPTSVWAQSLSGRVTGSFYAFERSDTVNVTSNHTRGYLTYQFDFGTANLALRAYGQLDNDFSTQLAGDGKARMYNLFLEWKNIARRAEIRLGRQSIFGGVAVGTIDGAQMKLRLGRWLRLKAFGGGLMPAHQQVKLTDDYDQNYMVGGQAVFVPHGDLNIGLSYFNKRQLRPGYEALRADSVGNVFTQFVAPSDRAFELASIDAAWTIKQKTSLYGRGDYDFYGDQLTRAEISARSEVSSRLTLNGSYTFRSPRLPWNSIFAAFNVEDNHEVEGGVYYRYQPALRFYGNLAGIFYSDDQSLRVTVGADLKYGGLNYVRRSGYAGELDGLNASIYYPLHNGQIMPSAQLSWASYKLDANASDRQTLFSAAAGLLARPWNLLTIDGQLQFLHNRYYSNDVRFLLRLQYWIFRKFGASS
ncbi:MAG: hypothetical protein ONA90_00445 [candidate division KSB1 bacterium]|nr:hypothetical protein [candidate division KSB1 bacterium]